MHGHGLAAARDWRLGFRGLGFWVERGLMCRVQGFRLRI